MTPVGANLEEIEIKNIAIEPAMKGLVPNLPATLFGTVTQIKGGISAKLSNPVQSALGDFAFQISDGGIKGINIIGEVLKKLLTIPIIGDSLSATMNPSVKNIINATDTTFSSLAGSVSIKDSTLLISSAKLLSEAYDIDLSGTYALSGDTKISSTLTLKPALAALLVASAKDLEKALNPDKSLSIPVKIEGSLPHIIITPDIEKIMKSTAGAAIKDAAVKALEKGLGKKSGSLKALKSLF